MKGTNRSRNRQYKPTTLVAPLLLIAACAGNDDGTIRTATPGGGQTAGSATAANTDLNAFQEQALQLVNDARAQGVVCGSTQMPPIGALQWNDTIESSAQSHSQYMKDSETFSHTGANGSTAGSRLTSAGYTWGTVGENIAAGYADVPTTVSGWLDSEGHCLNIMNGAFTQMGTAVIDGDAGNTYSNYWTMVLATPR